MKVPVYIVSGPNWICEVKTSAISAEFSEDFQIMEACTRCIESLCGQQALPILKLLHGNKPALDSLLLVTRQDDKPGRCAIIYTWICLANCGLHKEAARMQKVWNLRAKTL